MNTDDLQPQTTTWPSLRNAASSEQRKFRETLCGTVLFIKFKTTLKPYNVGMYTMAVGLLESETRAACNPAEGSALRRRGQSEKDRLGDMGV